MITTYGVKLGKYSGIVQSEVVMDELFLAKSELRRKLRQPINYVLLEVLDKLANKLRGC